MIINGSMQQDENLVVGKTVTTGQARNTLAFTNPMVGHGLNSFLLFCLLLSKSDDSQ